jgi:HTH-like domain
MLVDRLGLSERRACRIAGQNRSTQRHRPQAAPDDAALRKRLRKLSEERPRWGYRRAHGHLTSEGFSLNRKRVQRIWREEGLRVPAKAKKRRRLGDSTVPAGRLTAAYPNHVWALDYCHDATDDGHEHPPDRRSLQHRRWVTEVRFLLSEREPQGRWINETMLVGSRPLGAQIPDAVFEVRGERHAIEVELSQKKRSDYPRLWTLNSALYDAVIYFCEPGVARRLRRLQGTGDWPKVVIREIPGATVGQRKKRSVPIRQPTADESEVLRLIAEQGAIRIDQLGRFLRLEGREADQFLEGLLSADLVLRRSFFDGEKDWIHNSWAGNRLCGTRLRAFRPAAGGVKGNSAFNELRLFLSECAPQAEWISRRLLVETHGNERSGVPGAEVRYEGSRIAINFRASGANAATIVPRTDIQCATYDAVVFFCGSSRARRYMEHLTDQNGWPRVVIRDMPKLDARDRGVRRTAQELVGRMLGG